MLCVADLDPQFWICSTVQHTTVAKQSHTLVKSTAIISISAERYESQNNLMNIHVMNIAQKPLLSDKITQAWQNSLQQVSEIPPRQSQITQALERLYT